MAEDKQGKDSSSFEEMYPHSDPQSIKYRVVGALIILISCSLAWWLLLDHDVRRYDSVDSAINKPVNVERFEVPQEVIEKHHEYRQRSTSDENNELVKERPKKETNLASKPQKEKIATKAQPTKDVKKEPKKPAAKPKIQTAKKSSPALPDAWLLQLGSFTDKANAEKLRQRLYRSDIPAYIKTFNVDGRKIYRVLVGPKLDRKSVEAMEAKVRKKSGLQPLIVKFKPGFEE